ncbi:MAG TPA: hypothetical protein VNU03_19320, partial [Methylomirabilota bacterium]|nr:hypothetical protein [Methylomirabilota bacterium]
MKPFRRKLGHHAAEGNADRGLVDLGDGHPSSHWLWLGNVDRPRQRSRLGDEPSRLLDPPRQLENGSRRRLDPRLGRELDDGPLRHDR